MVRLPTPEEIAGAGSVGFVTGIAANIDPLLAALVGTLSGIAITTSETPTNGGRDD